jgi:alcohol dehydrogenase class IV
MLTDLAEAFNVPADNPEIGQLIGARVTNFVASLGIPARLRDAGVPREQIEPLAAAVVQELHGRDPAPVEELRALLAAAW